MRQLQYAFYAEGVTDNRFLPAIITRSIESILSEYINQSIEILEPHIINKSSTSQADNIVRAAKKASGYHFLIIHCDADDDNPIRAIQERFEPGIQKITQIQGEYCDKIIPIIPIYMSEAWMFADQQRLIENLGTELSAKQLNLPSLAQIEQITNPKQNLIDIINRVYASRRNPPDIGEFYGPLGNTISLGMLKSLSAYQAFYQDLLGVLQELGFIRI